MFEMKLIINKKISFKVVINVVYLSYKSSKNAHKKVHSNPLKFIPTCYENRKGRTFQFSKVFSDGIKEVQYEA